MNKYEYVKFIRNELTDLPKGFCEKELQYYIDYFENSHIDDTTDVTNIFGNPKDVANVIRNKFNSNPNLGNENNNYTFYQHKNDKSPILIILLILSFPIWLPIGLAAIAVIFALLISLFAVVAAIGISLLAVILVGIFLIPISFTIITESVSSFLFMLGCGLISLGVGVLLLWLMVMLISKIIHSLTNNRKRRAN